MRVEFTSPSERHRLCGWTAYRGKGERSVVPGSVMAAGAGLPHDIGQYVVEAATGLRTGFWGLVERGATFKSTGRRITKPGRALIVAHRAELDDAERIAGEHLARWHAGDVIGRLPPPHGRARRLARPSTPATRWCSGGRSRRAWSSGGPQLSTG